MIAATVLAAVGGALGAMIALRIATAAPANRATVLLLVAVATGFAMGAVARAGAVAHSSGIGAFFTGLCGTAVSFAALIGYFVGVPAGERARAAAAIAVIVASAVAAAILGYLAFDLLGLAYVKMPNVG